MAETEDATPGTGESLQVLQKEYDTLWSYIIHLDRERRDAVRFLFTALPAIPAAVYGVVKWWKGDGTMTMTPPVIAEWMLPLLVTLFVLGMCYFCVIVVSRVRAVEYTRKLNLTRCFLMKHSPGRYLQKLRCLDSDWLSMKHPDYVGAWGTDYWYRILAATPTSAVAGTIVYFVLVLIFKESSGWFVAAGGVVGVICALAMVRASSRYLRCEDCRAQQRLLSAERECYGESAS